MKFKWLRLAILGLLVWVIYGWFSGPSGIPRQIALYRQNTELREQIDSLQSVKSRLDKERSRLMGDTLYLEKVARLQLGMALKGERVYRLFEPKEGHP